VIAVEVDEYAAILVAESQNLIALEHCENGNHVGIEREGNQLVCKKCGTILVDDIAKAYLEHIRDP